MVRCVLGCSLLCYVTLNYYYKSTCKFNFPVNSNEKSRYVVFISWLDLQVSVLSEIVAPIAK